jgi:hypothetical protein
LIEETFEEMDAKDQVYLLNNYEKIKWFKWIQPPSPQEADDEHQVYIQFYKTAKDSKRKEQAIEARKTALKEQRRRRVQAEKQAMMWWQQPQQPWQWLANSAANQMIANSMSQQNAWPSATNLGAMNW